MFPVLFPLQNRASDCYLNSLLQALLSCETLTHHLAAQDLEPQSLAGAYWRLYQENAQSPHLTSAEHLFPWLPLVKGEQEDVGDGLRCFLEHISMGAPDLFHTYYQQEMRCSLCTYFTQREADPEILLDLTSSQELSNKRAVENYLRRPITIPDDYSCECCGARNKEQDYVVQFMKVQQWPTILVLMFKKTTQKFFPLQLDFAATHYQVVAQIEHHGREQGGHYRVFARRPTDVDFYERRRNKAQRMMIAQPGEAKKISAYLESQEEGPFGVFLFDDARIKYAPGGFHPTPQTYLVFYQVIP